MNAFRPIFLIAGNTVTGVLRGVVLNVLLVLGAVVIIGAMSTSAFSEVEMRRMIIDSGLAVISVLGALIAILTGFTMIPNEVESRTLYPVFSKPVRRWQFVLGKYLGAMSINALTVLLLSILFLIVYKIKIPAQNFDWRLVMAILMIFAMLAVLSAIIVFFSTFMSWIGTIIASMVIWFIGNYSQFLYDLAQKNESGGYTEKIFAAVQKLIPNFQSMDLRYDIVQLESVHIETQRWLMPLGSSAIYLVIALLLAILIFNYREL